eukprot:TRINITY_DN29359_c0_g1_i2.p2 TRINITY_DN29359_c0_g1~~TRINITY_DN29359_c0_g1_i2.p2  ORF type:complete len:126 (-),score=30.60 TRINITY_DN29359_c0_g1_i2:131-508(-)
MWAVLQVFFFFSSRRRHTRCREVSWARRCVQETGLRIVHWSRTTASSFLTWSAAEFSFVVKYFWLQSLTLRKLLRAIPEWEAAMALLSAWAASRIEVKAFSTSGPFTVKTVVNILLFFSSSSTTL